MVRQAPRSQHPRPGLRMANLVKRFLRYLGFDVCPHEFTRWEDMYTHSWKYDSNNGDYVESQNTPHTRLKQQRRCHECNIVEYRRLDLKTRSD